MMGWCDDDDATAATVALPSPPAVDYDNGYDDDGDDDNVDVHRVFARMVLCALALSFSAIFTCIPFEKTDVLCAHQTLED